MPNGHSKPAEHLMPPEDLKKRFGLAIKGLRKSAGVSQEALAERAGLHRTYISDIERGFRNISLVSIDNLARALGISLATLFQTFTDSKEVKGEANLTSKEYVPVAILLVKDNERPVELTMEAFHGAKVKRRIRVAAGGVKALECLLGTSGSRLHEQWQTHTKLILLDLDLPKVGGLNVLRTIRRNEHQRSIH